MAKSSLVLLLLVAALVAGAGAVRVFTITNLCPYTVYTASLGLGIGQPQHDTMHYYPSTGGRIWGRTGCSFDTDGGLHCDTGDCAGQAICNVSGTPPATLAEYTFGDHLDYYDVSVVDGFNIPMAFWCRDGGDSGVRCMDASCPEANHHADDGKIHACSADSMYYIVFCPFP